MNTRQRIEIESLLEELDAARRRIYLAKTYGVRPAGLRDLKDEVRQVQRRLAGIH
jgi:hypothetical protein